MERDGIIDTVAVAVESVEHIGPGFGDISLRQDGLAIHSDLSASKAGRKRRTAASNYVVARKEISKIGGRRACQARPINAASPRSRTLYFGDVLVLPSSQWSNDPNPERSFYQVAEECRVALSSACPASTPNPQFRLCYLCYLLFNFLLFLLCDISPCEVSIG